jgi:hypothetical protein
MRCERHHGKKSIVLSDHTRTVASFMNHDIAEEAAPFFLVITEHRCLPYPHECWHDIQRDHLRVWVSQRRTGYGPVIAKHDYRMHGPFSYQRLIPAAIGHKDIAYLLF